MKMRLITLCGFFPLRLYSVCVHFKETDDFFKIRNRRDSNAVIISYVGEKFSTEAIIPGEIDGHTVVKICEGAFYDHKYIKSVTVPNTVEIIEQSAFENCKELETVYFEDGDKPLIIGENAFKSCSYLKELKLSNRPTQIGDFAFKGCSRLSRLTVPESVTAIGFDAFDGCEQLIMNVEYSEIAKKYADEYSFRQAFSRVTIFTFIIIVSVTLILLVVIYVINRYLKRRKGIKPKRTA